MVTSPVASKPPAVSSFAYTPSPIGAGTRRAERRHAQRRHAQRRHAERRHAERRTASSSILVGVGTRLDQHQATCLSGQTSARWPRSGRAGWGRSACEQPTGQRSTCRASGAVMLRCCCLCVVSGEARARSRPSSGSVFAWVGRLPLWD